MKWLNKFMTGRYGGDQLSVVLTFLALFLTLVARFANIPVLIYIGYIPLVISIYRTFSKDINKRRMENYKFTTFMSPIYSWFKRTERKAKDFKTHKYIKCSNCGTNLRVPKKKGKIMVTCPKCKEKFEQRT
ncbi:hypothetical protein KQI41_00935 [Tissierella pigra]|uniref:Zn-finger containing protein n=1 Tax=Tissierella pigra TaxID=2607614 RepID=A0A6N7XNY1_9FIRM|nr:hypothetical protein [Tissierella pigra]MBU5424959.1 hypothetical protein [Tissierella pigra]MSU02532.1 hypothetical protein [Tissierella pigra]